MSEAYYYLRRVFENTQQYLGDDVEKKLIQDRLMELKHMTKPRYDERAVLLRYTPEQRELILKITAMPVSAIRRMKRKKWEPVHKFRWAINIVKLLVRSFYRNRQYLDLETNQETKKVVARQADKAGTADKPVSRSSLAEELQLSLTTDPDMRSPNCIKEVLRVLRATRAFKNLFPAEVEPELAKYVAYERYEDGRIIVRQGSIPERFYFILAGKAILCQTFMLSMGPEIRKTGSMAKGTTTNPEEMMMQWFREETLVAKGQLEVLILDRDVFARLQNQSGNPPISFIRSLPAFAEFPEDILMKHADSIEHKYYGPGRVIVKDSNRTPWIHIVKTGQVRVVRKQLVPDFNHDIGSISQKLPNISNTPPASKTVNKSPELKRKSDRRRSSSNASNSEKLVLPKILIQNSVPSPMKCKKVSIAMGGRLTLSETDAGLADMENGDVSQSLQIPHSAQALTSYNSLFPFSPLSKPEVVIEDATQEEVDKSTSRLFITREKTDSSALVTLPKRLPAATRQKFAYLQVGLIRAGGVFGLDHLQPPVAYENRGLSLLSDGAEVIKMSKRLFLLHAESNNILLAQTLEQDYISEDDAKVDLFEKESWRRYKSTVCDDVVRQAQPTSIR